MSLSIDFEIRGANRVRNQLRAAASFHAKDTDPIIGKHTKMMSAFFRAKQYPPRLPNQKYVRTYRLRRHFRAQRIKVGAWKIINRARGKRGKLYAHWVVKKGLQNETYHLGRWWTVEDESKKEMPKLTKNLSIRLEQILEAQSN